jgi:hypothetical protein
MYRARTRDRLGALVVLMKAGGPVCWRRLTTDHRGAVEILDDLEVVHVFIRRPHPSGQALHQTGEAHRGNCSSVGLPDEELSEERALRVRAMPRPVARLPALEVEVLTGQKGKGCWVLSRPRALHRLHHQGFGLPGTGFIACLDSPVAPRTAHAHRWSI